ncbi:MAG: hypothetical protein KGL39_01210 [Patescibacteria group bacterium]|nr:hypothetical protein [Patescibacteria group bacterium]
MASKRKTPPSSLGASESKEKKAKKPERRSVRLALPTHTVSGTGETIAERDAAKMKALGPPDFKIRAYRDFTSPECKKTMYADMTIRATDGVLYYPRAYLVMTDLELLKTMLEADKDVTELTLPFPMWAVNAMLNAAMGNYIVDWDQVIGALWLCHYCGAASTVTDLVAKLENSTLPWPIEALEEAYAYCGLNIRQLASAWLQRPITADSFNKRVVMTATGTQVGGDWGFGRPSLAFWQACETTINPRFDTYVVNVLSNHNVDNDRLEDVATHILHAEDKTATKRVLQYMFTKQHHNAQIEKIVRWLALKTVGIGTASYTSPFR